MKSRSAFWFWTGGLGLFIITWLDLCIGPGHIDFQNMIHMITNSPNSDPAWENIFYTIRLPKVCTALLCGASLSMAGLMMQTLFRNPLAGPFELGISSGASLGVSLLILLQFNTGPLWLQTLGLTGSAVLGSMIMFMMMMLFSWKINNSVSLLILGLMMAAFTGALVQLLQFFAPAEQNQHFLLWSFGSLSGVDLQHLGYFAATFILALTLALFLIKPLNGLLLGELNARSHGQNVRATRIGVLIAVSLLAGSTTAFCGPIGFIGVAVPHLCRSLFKTTQHRILLPGCAFMGAAILVLCDGICSWPERLLPINVITSIIGAPIVIWICLRALQWRAQ